MTNNKIATLFSVVLLTLIAGCGNNVLLTGKVTFSDDGSPLNAGTLLFDNGTTNARANIQPDGTFTVGTLKASDGLSPGEYRVCIAGAIKLLPCPQNEDADPDNNIYPPPFEQLIDKKYEVFETSGLTITVDASSKQYEISVDRP